MSIMGLSMTIVARFESWLNPAAFTAATTNSYVVSIVNPRSVADVPVS